LLPFAAPIEVARLVGPLCFGQCSKNRYAAKLRLNESDPGSSLLRTIEPQSATNREGTLRTRRLEHRLALIGLADGGGHAPGRMKAGQSSFPLG
jgi:hypothetical protein